MEGICHMCQRPRSIKWCPLCQHWLCDACRRQPVERIKAAIMAFVRPADDCCGPFVEAR